MAHVTATRCVYRITHRRTARYIVPTRLTGVHLPLVALVVRDYDQAIEFFVGTLGFELVEDSPSLTNDGRPKRWVVVRPPGAETGILLARADGPVQEQAIGNQFAGRVGFSCASTAVRLPSTPPAVG